MPRVDGNNWPSTGAGMDFTTLITGDDGQHEEIFHAPPSVHSASSRHDLYCNAYDANSLTPSGSIYGQIHDPPVNMGQGHESMDFDDTMQPSMGQATQEQSQWYDTDL